MTDAHQAALAMRNAQLFTEVDHKGRELAVAHETVQHQAAKLQEQTDQLRDWNKSLEERVASQLTEIGRNSRLHHQSQHRQYADDASIQAEGSKDERGRGTF